MGNVTKLFALGDEYLRLQLRVLMFMKRLSKKNIFLQQTINRLLSLKYQFLGSFPSNFAPIPHDETFASIITPPSKMQGEHWIMISSSRPYLHVSKCLECEKYSFFKQQYKQRCQRLYSVCSFYKVYAAFHPFNFRQDENTGIHDVNVLLIISIFM